jgi:hypothetical protein
MGSLFNREAIDNFFPLPLLAEEEVGVGLWLIKNLGLFAVSLAKMQIAKKLTPVVQYETKTQLKASVDSAVKLYKLLKL